MESRERGRREVVVGRRKGGGSRVSRLGGYDMDLFFRPLPLAFKEARGFNAHEGCYGRVDEGCYGRVVTSTMWIWMWIWMK